MCGIGHPEEKVYEPQVPKPDKFIPTEEYAHGPGGTCDVYMWYKDRKLITEIRELLSVQKELYVKYGYW